MLITLLASIFFVSYCECGTIVSTSLGKIEGFLDQSYNDRTFSSFLGVPYAEPPIGDLRFKMPRPVNPWADTIIANKTAACPQVLGGNYLGDEDCLYLNIYVPNKNPSAIKKKLPVLIDIHGGAFIFGSGRFYEGPKYMMDRDIILVTFNYRLGALGFLSTLDDVLPGNNGLKDQLLAIKWINKHISKFGGDPKKVTLSGASAGGASVHFHMLSNKSKNLYKNAISTSGSALNPWAMQEIPVEKAKLLASTMGCDTSSSSVLVDCLKQKPAQDIILTCTQLFFYWLETPLTSFGPVVEPPSCQGAFLTKNPYEIIKSGKYIDVPWITTSVETEGYSWAFELLVGDYMKDFNSRFNELTPYILDYLHTIPEAEKDAVSQKIRQFFYNSDPITASNFKQTVIMGTERLLSRGIEEGAMMHAQRSKSPVYMYQYNYTVQSMPVFYNLLTSAPYLGPGHLDDMTMIYSLDHQGFPRATISPDDLFIQQMLLDCYESFMNTCKPTSEKIKNWKPVSKLGGIDFLHIQNPREITMKSASTISDKPFWDSIMFRENEYYGL